MAEVSFVKLPPYKCHWTLQMVSQNCFRWWWLGAATTANVDSFLTQHMASPGHNESTHWGPHKWMLFHRQHFQVHFLVWIPIKISLKFVRRGPINNNPALVQIMAWPRSGDKPLSEAMMVSLPTHIGVTWPQRVKLWSDEFACTQLYTITWNIWLYF